MYLGTEVCPIAHTTFTPQERIGHPTLQRLKTWKIYMSMSSHGIVKMMRMIGTSTMRSVVWPVAQIRVRLQIPQRLNLTPQYPLQELRGSMLSPMALLPGEIGMAIGTSI